MHQKRSKPARGNGTGLGITNLTSFNPDNTENLSEVQAAFLAARFRLDGVRARVVAELAWWRA